jgi:hypothetical protein
MPRKKRSLLAMMENLTKTAGENTPKRQKHDHPSPKPKPGKLYVVVLTYYIYKIMMSDMIPRR